MASLARRAAANAPGELFVDDTCIACDTCRRIDPATYGGGEDDASFVARQPRTPDEELRALMALVACPVSAIGTAEKRAAAAARAALPGHGRPWRAASPEAAREAVAQLVAEMRFDDERYGAR